MNAFKMMLAAATIIATSCGGPTKEAPKVLVLYYSQTTNTKAVAQQIADALGADIEEVSAVIPYDGSFKETIDRCIKEKEEGILPEIRPITSDIAAYDVIFLGYPVWFGTFAPPVATLLNQIDLSGKKVVPFCTFGSGGLYSSIIDLKEKQPEAEILPGYGVRAARLDAMPGEIDQFLKENGLLEGEFVHLEDFPEEHPVNEEESAIFDAAVGDYPMISAQATSVASRPVPDGVEYRFTAASLPREGMSAPPSTDMTIFVLVQNGLAPVFTQVIR